MSGVEMDQHEASPASYSHISEYALVGMPAMTKAEQIAARNRFHRQRLGKYLVPDETVHAMAAMRQRGKTWGQIAMRFGVTRHAARNRVARRWVAPC